MRLRILKNPGLLLSLIFVVLVLRSVDWSTFPNYLMRFSVLDLLVLIVIYLLGFIVRGLRFSVLMPGMGFYRSTAGVFVGYAANNVLPARLGEFARAHVVGLGTKTKRATVLSSVFIERIFDGSAIVFLLILGAHELDLPSWARSITNVGIFLFASMFFVILLLARYRSVIEERLVPLRFKSLAEAFLSGFSLAARSIPVLGSVIVLSLAVWVVEAGMFYYGARALEFELSFRSSLFVLGIVNLGVLIPSSPGNVGTFQYFAVLALSVFAIGSTESTAYAVVLHACQYLPVTLIGFLALPVFGMSKFSDLRAIRRKHSPDAS